MNQTVDSKRYYPTALALYITYFVLGIAATIMGQYKQDFAAMWGAATLADGSFDVSGVVAVIAAIGLGRLIAFPVAGPLSDRLGRRLSGLIGCALYAIFFLGITYAPNLYVGYALAIISGMANSFLDTSITPSCMEIFKEKGTIANIFTKLSISIAQFLLPFAIGVVAARELPFQTIFLATAAIIIVDGIFLAFLPFPPFEKAVKGKGPKEKMRFTPSAVILVVLGFTTSTTFMLWMNCNQELGRLYGLADPSKIQSFYSVGIVCALFVSAALLKRKVEPARILVAYPTVAFLSLGVIYFVQSPAVCLAGGFLLGFFAAGGVLQLVSAVANEMFPKHRGVITSIVMISSSVANYLVISVAGVLTRVGGTNGPRLVLLFNMAVTLVGILLAVYLNICQKRERAAEAKA
jgi:MFS family permease